MGEQLAGLAGIGMSSGVLALGALLVVPFAILLQPIMKRVTLLPTTARSLS